MLQLEQLSVLALSELNLLDPTFVVDQELSSMELELDWREVISSNQKREI
jgi:hypothetical protein